MPEDREPPAPDAAEEPLLEISPDDLEAQSPPPPEATAATPVPASCAPPVSPVPPAAPAELPAAPPVSPPGDLEVTLVEPQQTTPPPVSPPVTPVSPAEVIPPTAPPEPAASVAPASAVEAPPPGVTPPPASCEIPAAPTPVAEPAPAPPITASTPTTSAPAPGPTLAAESKWYTFSGGKVYGPYEAEHIRAWLRSGQISWDTQASRGAGDPWRPLSAIAEFNPGPQVGAPVAAAVTPGQKDKTVAGILGILLGWLGIHHFYLGNTGLGLLYLLVSVLSVGILSGLPAIAGLIEGIIYLTAPEDRFQRNYHRWFLAGP